MKQKIKEALKQKYGTRANKELGQLQLGIGDEVFERVAASVETFITEESAIDAFVGNESTLNLLKSYQSVNDKLRALENKPKPQPQPHNDNSNQADPTPNPTPTPKVEPTPDAIPAWAQALLDSNKALSEELATFKAEQNAKSAFGKAESTFKGNVYVKEYADEATDAWERAIEMYEATGKTWTAEQLSEKAMGYFNKAVAKKGVDTNKPFDSDGAGKREAQTDKFVSALRKSGRIADKQQ